MAARWLFAALIWRGCISTAIGLKERSVIAGQPAAHRAPAGTDTHQGGKNQSSRTSATLAVAPSNASNLDVPILPKQVHVRLAPLAPLGNFTGSGFLAPGSSPDAKTAGQFPRSISEGSMLDWAVLTIVIMVALLMDIVVARRGIQLGIRGHLATLLCWLAASAGYGQVVCRLNGFAAYHSWRDAYSLGWTLNIENLIAFHVILAIFNTPEVFRPRALMLWIFGVLLLPLTVFATLAGGFDITRWIQVACAGLLVYRGFFTAAGVEDDLYVYDEWTWNVVESWRPWPLWGSDVDKRRLSSLWAGGRTVTDGLLLVVIALWGCDLVLAQEEMIHSRYLSTSATVLCMGGMRSMLFMIEAMVDSFDLLKYGIAAVLVCIGAAMALSGRSNLSGLRTLEVISSIAFVCIVASVVKRTRGNIQDRVNSSFEKGGFIDADALELFDASAAHSFEKTTANGASLR